MLKDKFGEELKVNHLFAHPGRSGSSCWINVYRVVDLIQTKDWRGNDITLVKAQNIGPRNSCICYDRKLQVYRKKTQQELDKDMNKIVTISTFGNQSVILN